MKIASRIEWVAGGDLQKGGWVAKPGELWGEVKNAGGRVTAGENKGDETSRGYM